MYNNNNFNGGYFYGNGFGAGQQYMPAKKARFTNPLSEEDKKSLQERGGFSLYVDDKEMKKSYCTHKDGDKFSLRANNDGTHTCYICGETFELADLTPEMVRDVTNQFLDVLQSIKTYYLDIPESVVREFFQMIPFIKKTPEIYKLALDNFHSYENPMTNPYNQGNQLFSMYDSMGGPGYMYNPNFQQPMGGYVYGMPPQQPPQYNQQGYQQQQGYPVPQPIPNGAQPVGGFGYVDNGYNQPPIQQQPPQQVQMQIGQQNNQQHQQQAQAPVSPMPQPGTTNGTKSPVDIVNQTKTFQV